MLSNKKVSCYRSYSSVLGTKEKLKPIKNGLVTIEYVNSLIRKCGNKFRLPITTSPYVKGFVCDHDRLRLSLQMVDQLIDKGVFATRIINELFNCPYCEDFPEDCILCDDCEGFYIGNVDLQESVLYNIRKKDGYKIKNNIKSYDLSISHMELRSNPIFIDIVEKYHLSSNLSSKSLNEDSFLEKTFIYYLPPDLFDGNFYRFSGAYMKYDETSGYKDDFLVREKFDINTDCYKFYQNKIKNLEIVCKSLFLNLYFPKDITNIITYIFL